jgi:subtilisin family serine protease
MKSLINTSLLLAFILFTITAFAQKKVIKSQDDVPRFTYEIPSSASEIFTISGEMDKVVNQLQKDYLTLINEYDIQDKTLMKGILGTLKNIDLYQANYQGALKKVEQIRGLQEKPSDKLLSGLSNIAYLKALSETGYVKNEAFQEKFVKYFSESISGLPWEVVQDDVEGTKGTLEIYSENLALGLIKERIDPGVAKTGTISDDNASTLVNMNYVINHVLPVKDHMIAVYESYIAANKVEKADIWADREVDLSQEANLSPVIMAIWDSGVDVPIFNDQLYTNAKEQFDGTDTDGNGFIDDVNGIAYDLHSHKTNSVLYPLSDEQKDKLPEMVGMVKGLQDLQANISSQEASELKKFMSQIKPEEVRPFIEELNLFGNYAHGTHVAGIAAKGNPKAMVLPARITFDYRMVPEPPTKELYAQFAVSAKESIEYFKQAGVKVVNMSWGDSPESVEGALEVNGIGESAEERKQMAREIFDLGKEGLYEAIKGAPEILFVTSAGNSDQDSEFYEDIPSSFELPNILTVGAVDQAGEETGFTSFGETVDVHANGFEVDSYIPGGQTMKMSGTSMSSPNVVNLAGKLWSIEPDLSVQEVINLIKEGAEISEDGRRTLINPKASVELLRNKMN